MKHLLKFLLIIPVLTSSLSVFGYVQIPTQTGVPSYEDIIDNYRKLYTKLFAGKEDILMHSSITLEQLRSWNDFKILLSDYIGQDLTAKYLSPDDALRKALQLPDIISTHNLALKNAGLELNDLKRKNRALESTGVLSIFLNQTTTNPVWINETIIEPLQSMIEELELFGITKNTRQAALIIIARGLINNWKTVAKDLEQLQEFYGEVQTSN